MINDPNWTHGFSRSELDRAEDRFEFSFPPDLRFLLLDRRPIQGHDWANLKQLAIAFDWPYQGLLFDVENNDFWMLEWGARPLEAKDRAIMLQSQIDKAPTLLPLINHRFLPADPCKSGNPVFSVYQSDVIYYGSNLDDYFHREFNLDQAPDPSKCGHIPFWSELAKINQGQSNF